MNMIIIHTRSHFGQPTCWVYLERLFGVKSPANKLFGNKLISKFLGKSSQSIFNLVINLMYHNFYLGICQILKQYETVMNDNS